MFTAREGDALLVNTNLTKETAENYGQKEPRIRFSDSGTQMSQKTKYKKTSFPGGKDVQKGGMKKEKLCLYADHMRRHHLPEDGELLCGDEHIGQNEDKPELLHVLLFFAEEIAVGKIRHGVHDQNREEHDEKALLALLGGAGVEREERVI